MAVSVSKVSSAGYRRFTSASSLTHVCLRCVAHGLVRVRIDLTDKCLTGPFVPLHLSIPTLVREVLDPIVHPNRYSNHMHRVIVSFCKIGR